MRVNPIAPQPISRLALGQPAGRRSTSSAAPRRDAAAPHRPSRRRTARRPTTDSDDGASPTVGASALIGRAGCAFHVGASCSRRSGAVGLFRVRRGRSRRHRTAEQRHHGGELLLAPVRVVTHDGDYAVRRVAMSSTGAASSSAAASGSSRRPSLTLILFSISTASVRVVLEEPAGVLLALAELVAVVGVPGSRTS